MMLAKGYQAPLYLLPFDHRHSYVTNMFKFSMPLTPAQRNEVIDSKLLIYEGFKFALSEQPIGSAMDARRLEAGRIDAKSAAILIDEEFGTPILNDAAQYHFSTALSVEKSGVDEFDFEYGENFAQHIETFNPTFAKILVRYNPDGDAAMNARQAARMRRLSDYCQRTQRLFMLELLVPATPSQLTDATHANDLYDDNLRPALMAQAIRALQEAGIAPDIWKVEGLIKRDDCEEIVRTVRREGRDKASCIVLGRNASEAKVVKWLSVAASVEGFIGFAVGRTTFWDAVAQYREQKISRQDARLQIAKRYLEWVSVFEQARQASVIRPRAII